MRRIWLWISVIVVASVSSFEPSGKHDTTRKHSSVRLDSNSISNEQWLQWHECQLCCTKFASRNALFRHIRSDPACSRVSGNTDSLILLEPTRFSFALQFSYWSQYENLTAQDSGCRLKQAFLAAMDGIIQCKLNANLASEFVSSTQVSISRLRHTSLAQEPGCYAAEDVLVISIMAPRGLLERSDDVQSDVDETRSFLSQLTSKTNERLTGCNKDIVLMLIGCKFIPSDAKFHAERSCTQRVFHYLMPLTWLPEGQALEKWWLEHGSVDESGTHKNRASERPPSNALRAMKNALRSAESPTLGQYTKEQSELLSVKVATGRFGKLSAKRRMPWHNFADPALRGNASPNNEPVWRVIDRARIIEMVEHRGHDGKRQVVAVLEFRGDEFLPQQVRRIVGTGLAIAHGWLPNEMFEFSLSSNVVLEAPLAPAGRLYLAGSRFHFDELRNGGKNIFSNDAGGVSFVTESCESQATRLRDSMLNRLLGKDVQDIESQWLTNLETVIAPRLRLQISARKFQNHYLPVEQTQISECQETKIYERTLASLRHILRSGLWPETSTARSSVINMIAKTTSIAGFSNGSFTVVNPSFHDGLYRHGIGNDSLPFANAIFPELVEAVFDLESCLSDSGVRQAEDGSSRKSRPTSSHCAVNCNAQFTPHVDSGRGAGQSLSMIVGLGDYAGGELAIEGQHYDVHYQPLEFDGWNNRHWTLPFDGERFSLVWFTPEMK